MHSRHFSEGHLKVYQHKNGYRFAIDAFILANFIHLKKKETVLELGTSCGIISLILAYKFPQVKKILGIEIQSNLVSLAKKNVTLNQRENLIEILQTDIKNLTKNFPSASFDVVVSNPPYYSLKEGRLNPDTEKAIARHEIKGSLLDVVKIGQYMLKQKGRFYFIYPAFRCEHLFVTLRNYNLEPKRLRFVHPYRNKEAKQKLSKEEGKK
jgi:tRNA1(Val) A37 N6-methylase TrmN6